MRGALLFAAAATLLPLAARAQTPDSTSGVARDTLGVRLRAGEWRYTSTLEGDGRSRRVGTRTLTITPVTEGGEPAWLVVDAQVTGPTRATDSLFLARADLASLRRVARIAGPMGDMTLSAAFTADSVTGRITIGGESQPIAMANVAGAISGDATLVAALPVMPLRARWSAVLTVLSPQARSAAPLKLAVVDEVRLRVPAGTFNTWVVEAEAGQSTATYYVAKNGGPVVMMTAPVPQVGGGVVETVLERGKK
jgi:hypothetical protein